MKSMFVVSDVRVNRHVGEEYDVIIEVPDQPTTENIQPFADKIMAGIRDLWGKDVGSNDPMVVVLMDAATPFAAVLTNLQIIMKVKEGIVIDLPWERPLDVNALDKESKEVLKKLEQGK